jgi:hypothetical protein
MNLREVLALAPLAVFVFWIGLVPNTFLHAIGPAVKDIQEAVSEPFERHYADGTPPHVARQSAVVNSGKSNATDNGQRATDDLAVQGVGP